MQIDLSKIYTPQDFAMATAIAEDAVKYFKSHPCGIKFLPTNVKFGILMVFSKKYESKLSAKMLNTIAGNIEATIILDSIIGCEPKTCYKGFTSFTDFEQFYFRYLFRMCHAGYLASTGKHKDFAVYLDDNERVRRIIRPKHGERIMPLFKLNTEVFKEGKKALV